MNRWLLQIGLFLPLLAFAQGEDALIRAENAWARATPPGSRSAAVYLRLVNDSVKDLSLTGVYTDIAGSASIHETRSNKGMMRMGKTGAFSLKGNETRIFKPGGLHIMLMGLQENLVEGTTFSVRVEFGEVTVQIPVKVMPLTQVSEP